MKLHAEKALLRFASVYAASSEGDYMHLKLYYTSWISLGILSLDIVDIVGREVCEAMHRLSLDLHDRVGTDASPNTEGVNTMLYCLFNRTHNYSWSVSTEPMKRGSIIERFALCSGYKMTYLPSPFNSFSLYGK